ncbi:MAG: HEAT repeat domain-containing protein [Deltaproteobacteria bacterium]|nr:HEAT repeat domain-containing protein [Deltaproteobacteria bacterium]
MKVAVSAGAQPIVVGEIWVSDETGAAVPRDRRPMEKAELERIVFEAFRAQGGRQKTAASGRLQVRVAVATRKKHESFVAVSGVLSLDDDRFEANAIGFRPVPKGEGADRTYREIVERAVRDTVESLALKVRVPKLPVDQLVALLKSRPDGGAEGERRLIAANELAERRDPAHFDLFVALLKDDEPAVARRAVGALVSLKDARAVNPLIDFAARKDPQTLREVIYALGDLGGAKAEAFLWTLEKGHEHPAIRQAAHDAIDLLKKKR